MPEGRGLRITVFPSLYLFMLKLLLLRSEICWFLAAEDVVNPPTLICAGCPRAIPNDSPELTELLKVSMEKYNSETNDDFYYKAGVIESATVQVGSHSSF